MWWLLIWAFLLLVAGVYLGARAWRLWGQTKELGSELLIAQNRLDDVQSQLRVLEDVSAPERLAVFSDVATARKERDRAKASGQHDRRARRAFSHPVRAKHVD